MFSIFNEIPDIIKYKELLKNLVLRDIKIRYKRSALGFLWVMLNSFLMVLILYAVFSGLFWNKVHHFTAYIMSGIIIWHLFSQSTQLSGISFIHNRNIINKIYLPKSIFPMSVVTSALVHFLFSLVPLVFILVITKTSLSHNIVWLPFVIGLIYIFSLGISLTVSTLAVFFQDVIYIYDVILLGGMYASAIFYPVSIVPKKFLILLQANPMFHYIMLFRACLYDDTIPKMNHLFIGTLCAFASISIGWLVYNKYKDRIIFYL
jgi:ABC-type polysaccharide/polyol phosphate export permease